jgi:tRNA dimethylallyltransferase
LELGAFSPPKHFTALMSKVSSIFLVGPTASGKSAVALALAEKVGGEIISVDSMQVYRGLNIGTAKPSAGERARVPHHLIDVVEITEPFDAARFVELARRTEADIRARERVPILCGGTGLYFKAFLEGLGSAPPSDANLRAELEATPLEQLLHELSQRDPVTYERIDRQNPRRVIRALEVIRLTGKPFSEQRAEWQPSRSSRGNEAPTDKGQSLLTSAATKIFGLLRSNEDLHARINARVDEMFARGLVEETRALLGRGLEQNKTALQAIGYRQVVEHLRGERPLAETIELVKSKTRQFAKRQITWFRRQLSVEWISVEAQGDIHSLTGRIARLSEHPSSGTLCRDDVTS